MQARTIVISGTVSLASTPLASLVVVALAAGLGLLLLLLLLPLPLLEDEVLVVLLFAAGEARSAAQSSASITSESSSV
jgi:hypothetical protein